MRDRAQLIVGLVLVLGSMVGASLTMAGSPRGGPISDHMRWMWAPESSAQRRPAVPGAQEFVVKAGEFRFAPSRIEVPSEEPINITLVNDGALLHDLTILGLGFQLVARPGERSSGSVSLDAGDQQAFECTVPGHAEAGMIGVLIGS
jgi:uncharacterized cupredoxin-like copper-binding protein